MDPKIVFVTIITAAVGCIRGIDLSKRNLIQIPHDKIAANDTIINLQANRLTAIGDSEFSSYTQLIKLNLRGNLIASIANNAFNSTALVSLDLGANKLTQLPNLAIVADTLSSLTLFRNDIGVLEQGPLSMLKNLGHLDLRYNPLTSWPDFTEVGSLGSSSALYIRPPSMLTLGSTICHFTRVRIVKTPPGEVPFVNCNTTGKLYSVGMERNGYTADTDFTNLTSFVETASLEHLTFFYSDFSQDFPDLPHIVRETITSLNIYYANVETISPDRLQHYSLAWLRIYSDKLKTLPKEAFQVTEGIVIGRCPWQEFGHEYWSDVICHESFLTEYLQMGQSINDLAQLQVFEPLICAKGSTLQFWYLETPRCDCSTAWMFRAVKNCPISLRLQKKPCGASSWTDAEEVLNCPERFVLYYTINGSSLESQNFDTIGPTELQRVYVHGKAFDNTQECNRISLSRYCWDQVCVIRTASNTMSVHGEGMVLFPHEVEATLQYFTNNVKIIQHNFPDANPCYVPDNALTDGDVETCHPVHHNIHTVTFAPRVWVNNIRPISVLLVTRNLTCTHPFHMRMSYKVSNTCSQEFQQCQLLSVHQQADRDLCEFECDCAATNCAAMMLRVAHIEQGGLCDIIIHP